MNDVILSDDPSAAAASAGSVSEQAAAGGHPHEPLDVESVLALLAYEESHGKRPAVVQALKERLAAVRSGLEPSGPLGAHLPRQHPFAD
ncbi:MAG: hypothetical protein ABWX76_13490 [Leifsonia flava]